MRKIIIPILFFLLLSSFVVSYNSRQVFTKLIDVESDLTSAYAIFEFKAPVHNLKVHHIGHDFKKDVKTKDIKINSMDYFMRDKRYYQVPIYEKKQVEKSCERINNKTGLNETYDCSYFEKVQIGAETKTEYVWKKLDKNYRFEEGIKYTIKVVAHYKAELGERAIDWIPSVNVRGQKLRRPEWAWWNSSWDSKKQINFTADNGNFTTFTIDYDSDMNADFSDLRFVNGTESTELNFTFRKVVDSTFALITVYSQGENYIYMYYGNSGASYVNNTGNTYFEAEHIWFFDYNADDYVGSEDGTAQNDASLTNGNINGSYTMDGTDDYVDTSYNSKNDVDSGEFTVAAWANYDTAGLNVMHDYNSGSGYYLQDDKFYIFGDSNSGGVELTSQEGSGNWYHIVGVREDNTLRIYANGEENNTNTITTGGIADATNNLRIGAASHDGSGEWEGEIDEVGFWKRALSATEVYELSTSTEPTVSFGSEEADNTAPTVTINDPENTTYWYNTKWYDVGTKACDADIPVNISVSDDKSGLECTVFVNGVLRNETTGNTTILNSVDLYGVRGNELYNATVNCTDSDGATASDNISYTLSHHYIEDIVNDSVVYEGETASYVFKLVNKIEPSNTDEHNAISNADFIWNGTEYIAEMYSDTTIGSTIYERRYRNYTNIPMIQSNDTEITFSWNYSIILNGDCGSHEDNYSLDSMTQKIYFGYWLKDEFSDKTNYVENENIDFYVGITNKSNSFSRDVKVLFDGTNYTASYYNSSNTYTYYKADLTAPEVSGDSQTFDLNATITVSDGTDNRSFTSSTDTITVYKPQITACGNITNTTTLNFTLKEEQTQTTARGDLDSIFRLYDSERNNLGNFTFNETNQTYFDYCIYPSYESLYVDSFQTYTGDGYSQRDWFMSNDSVSNSTKNTTLYLLNESDSYDLHVNVENKEQVAAESAIVHIQRFLVSDDSYITVAHMLTDENGDAYSYVVENDVYYRFLVYDDFNLDLTTQRKKLVDEEVDTVIDQYLKLEAQIYTKSLIFEGDLGSTCVFDNSTDILTCNYSDISGDLNNVSFEVERMTEDGYTNICDLTSTSSSDSLTCDLGVNATNQTHKFALTGWTDDGKILINSGLIDFADVPDHGKAGLFMGFLLFLVLTFAGLWNPSATIGLGVIALVFSLWLGLIAVSWSSIIAIIVVSVILIFKVSKR